MSRAINDATFWEYVHSKYKGKVHRMERLYRPEFIGVEVHIMFRIPIEEADEIEMYKRINKVIHVIAEGD